MTNLLARYTTVLIIFLLARSPSRADDSVEQKTQISVAEQILGEWVQSRETPQGRLKTVKDHRGDYSILTVYAPNGQKIYAHRSEYEIDESAGAAIFRYRNKVILIGPQAGTKDAEEKAYIFRIEEDIFYEVHGMLPGDTGNPSLIKWERESKTKAVVPEV